jgi:hypothetical protein
MQWWATGWWRKVAAPGRSSWAWGGWRIRTRRARQQQERAPSRGRQGCPTPCLRACSCVLASRPVLFSIERGRWIPPARFVSSPVGIDSPDHDVAVRQIQGAAGAYPHPSGSTLPITWHIISMQIERTVSNGDRAGLVASSSPPARGHVGLISGDLRHWVRCGPTVGGAWTEGATFGDGRGGRGGRSPVLAVGYGRRGAKERVRQRGVRSQPSVVGVEPSTTVVLRSTLPRQ